MNHRDMETVVAAVAVMSLSAVRLGLQDLLDRLADRDLLVLMDHLDHSDPQALEALV